MITCCLAACSLDRTGLETDGASLIPGRIDASPDVPALDVSDAGTAPVTPDSADDANSADRARNEDTDNGANVGDGAGDLPEMLDAAAIADADAVEVAVDVRPPASVVGCADGVRDGLIDLAAYPAIAACAGGWEVPGLLSNAARSPACARGGGNQGERPNGQGCSATDLCAAGWHVCDFASEVAARGGKCADAVAPANGSKVFYATRQLGDDRCAGDGSEFGGDNFVHGCGNVGLTAGSGCAPLNGVLHENGCSANPPWRCNAGNNLREISTVTKPGAALGGVLCCKD